MNTIRSQCPFCGGEFTANAETESVIHSTPPCDEFMKDRPPVEFLIAARRKLVGRMPWDDEEGMPP